MYVYMYVQYKTCMRFLVTSKGKVANFETPPAQQPDTKCCKACGIRITIKRALFVRQKRPIIVQKRPISVEAYTR